MRQSAPTPPATGCLGLLLVACLIVLLPLFMADIMTLALQRLRVSPAAAGTIIIGMFLGSLINIPIRRIRRDSDQPLVLDTVFGGWGPVWPPRGRQLRNETILAVNVGGCLIPATLCLWEMAHLLSDPGWPLAAVVIVAAVNSAVCFYVARPVAGVGIAIPALASPLTAVALAWALLGSGEFAAVRPAVAFVGGVLGPLIGADLLHLRDISRITAGLVSIGGAGTFDGIVLSGVLAALLA